MKGNRRRYLIEMIIILILGTGGLLVSLSVHQKSFVYSWKGEIWADRAGYYVYLPAFFKAKMDGTRFPEKIADKTGNGFSVEGKKISTKYTCGVALLLSPFFVTTHYVAKILHLEQDMGFGAVYHRMTGIAAIFYFVLGMLMLSRFLSFYFRDTVRYIALVLIFLGTNLFYYSVLDPMMSHVYSFFLFSGFLLFFRLFLDSRRMFHFAVVSLFMGLIILVRPTNVLIFSVFFLWDITSWNDFSERVRLILNPVRLAVFLGIVFLVLLPQMLYWKYLHGSFLFYSYGNEGFTSWNQPKLMEIWFSTLNGWVLYSPMVIFLVGGIFLMIRKKLVNGYFILGFFLAVSYMISSWYSWYYGCSFGQRSYVEYYTVLAIPFGFVLNSLLEKRMIILKSLLILVMLFMAYAGIRLMFAYEGCFYGSTWDWNQYSLLLEKADLIKNRNNTVEIINDFENNTLVWPQKVSTTMTHSGLQSVVCDSSMDFCCRHEKHFWDFRDYYPTSATVTLWFLNRSPLPTGALLVCSVEKDGKAIYWQSRKIDEFLKENEWSRVKGVFPIPWGMESSVSIVFYIWNRNSKDFLADDLIITFDK